MPTRKKIYIADDEKDIRDLLERFLEEAGYQVTAFSEGGSLLNAFLQDPADLVILDVMMPGKDGFEISKSLRDISNVPIVLLTAKDTDMDYILGFTAGCDDYFSKPFSPIKLMMRVNAILKRQDMLIGSKLGLQYSNIHMDLEGKPKNDIHLTRIEWDLLMYLMERPEQAVMRDELLNEVWGYRDDVETRVTDDTVKRLRKKLSEANSQAEIETIWGYGFRIVERKET